MEPELFIWVPLPPSLPQASLWAEGGDCAPGRFRSGVQGVGPPALPVGGLKECGRFFPLASSPLHTL